MKEELRILLVEDQVSDAELEIRELKRAGLRVVHRLIDTEPAFREALQEFRPELIISDFSMPHFDGMWALTISRELAPDVPFIFVSGTIGEEYAIRALKNGAIDYVLKNNLVRLPAAVERAMQDKEIHAARRRAEEEIKHQRAFLRQVIDLDRNLIFAKDRQGRFVLLNLAMAELFGTSVEAMLGKTLDDMGLDKDMAERMRADDLDVMRTLRDKFVAEERVVDAAGRERWFQVVKRPIIGPDGKADMVLGVATDITERKNQELKIARLSRIHAVLSGINSAIVRIRDRQQLFDEACRIAVEHGGFGIAWIGTLNLKTLEINPVASAGIEADSFLAKSQSTVNPATSLGRGMVGMAVREKRAAFSNDLTREDLSSGGERRKEALRRGYRSVIVLPLLVDGAAVGNMSLFAKEPNFFDDEEIKLLSELSGDISFALEHIAKEEKLNYLAYYDPLTGLPNRTLLHDRINQLLQSERDSESKAALLIADLKRFGSVNDTYGRQTGDNLLKAVAERLEDVLASREWLARIEANSFAIVLRDVRQEADVAHALEQGILSCLNQPFPVAGEELRLSAQVGIALFPGDGKDAESLFRNADAALKKAKGTGDHYLFYAPQMNSRVAEQLKLENDLRDALLQEQYVLHYQPKFDLANGRMVGMEALIRWQHPERGMVSPADFVPLLEETGMILEVGRWALRRAALEHAAWCAQGLKPPRVSVNVSPVQLRRNDFVDYVKEALGAVNGAADRIDIEITESMLMEDIAGSIGKLKALKLVI